MALQVFYASRFGTTETLALALAEQLTAAGSEAVAIPIDEGGPDPGSQQVLLTAIIWDRPIPAMRNWIETHQAQLQATCISAGVVCGAAGVRETGGMVYARNLCKRIGNENLHRFALSGEIPPREELKRWEWIALKLFAFAMRKPQLFEIAPGLEKLPTVAGEISALP